MIVVKNREQPAYPDIYNRPVSVMADSSSTSGTMDSKKSNNVPRKPAKYGHYERTVVDYVRTATAKNVWYYRYVVSLFMIYRYKCCFDI